MDSRARTCLRLPIPLVLAALLASAATADEVHDTLAMDKLTTEQITIVSRTGKEIVDEIAAARKSLASKDWTSARTHVATARSDLARIRDLSPSSRIQDGIGATLRALHASEPKRAQQEMLPLYAELDVQKEEVALDETRRYVNEAKGKLAEGSHVEAEEALVAASAHVAYLEIDLPIQETYGNLTSALIALRRKELQRADSQLREAQNQIQKVTGTAAAYLVDSDDLPAVGAQ